MDTADTKTCTKCGETKPLDAFGKHDEGKHGKRPDCKTCCNARARVWREKNADRQRAWFAARYERDKEKLLAQQKARYLRDRERILERQREYRLANLEASRESARRYAATHRDEARVRARAAYRANRQLHIDRARARLLQVASFPPVDRDAVFERDGGRCGICGDVIEGTHWHLDHILPLTHGGRHCWFNVQPTHDPCNRRKGASIMARVLPPITAVPTR